MPDNLISIHGRKFGIDKDDNLLINGEIAVLSEATIRRGVATVTVTSAQLLALNATPQTIVPAQGANLVILPTLLAIRHNGGTAYGGIAVGEDLVLKYTNGSGAQCSAAVEATGFLDQTTAQTRVVRAPSGSGATPADFTPVANTPVVLHMLTGEITTGNFPLIVRCWYDVIPINFS